MSWNERKTSNWDSWKTQTESCFCQKRSKEESYLILDTFLGKIELVRRKNNTRQNFRSSNRERLKTHGKTLYITKKTG